RTRLIGQFHLFMQKPRSGGVFAIRIPKAGLMTVHDAIPKERGLSVSFTFLCQNPAPAGFLLSESVTRMNNCPRRYTRRTRLIGQLPLFNHLRIL
ncbi:hypothetical protein DMS56_24270, partial [Klebsiella variicola]